MRLCLPGGIPFPTVIATPPAFPDATNTGVPPGTVLTNTSGRTITTNGLTINAENISGTLTIQANNVTVQNCKLNGGGANYGIQIRDDLGFGNLTVKDCEIFNAQNCIASAGLVQRCNIYNMENGVNFFGPTIMEDCYLHDFGWTGSPHYDGTECNGGGNHTIRHNTIILNFNFTGCVQFNNFFAGVSNCSITGNYLEGGSYVIYNDASQGPQPIVGSTMVYRNNSIKLRGAFGAVFERDCTVDFDASNTVIP
jgi:hypothetical protein